MKYDYLYLEDSKIVRGEEKFKVIKIGILKNDRWEAELKARRFVKDNKLGKLAGGCFSSDCKPNDFKKNYKIFDCPINYKPAKENKQDKFITALIDYENNLEYILI